MTFVLGISAFYHDSAAALLRDGNIVAAAQEERFTRIKGDASFPMNAITYCLESADITPENLSCVAYYDKPQRTLDRLLQSVIAHWPKSWSLYSSVLAEWSTTKRFVEEIIRSSLQTYSGPIYFTPHHLAHAAAAYYPSRFDSAGILSIDGVGEWSSAAQAVGTKENISIIKELLFPDSLGLLYSAFTYFCGFKVNFGEYKLMGLAPYGNPRFLKAIVDNVASIDFDGAVRLNLDYFSFHYRPQLIEEKFARLFGGPARQPESQITTRELDLAASIQKFTEMAVLAMAQAVKHATQLDNLCLAGGVALNCVANGKLYEAGLFKNIFVQPAAGDAGSALGAAYAIAHNVCGIPRLPIQGFDRMQGSLLGPSYRRDEIRTFLDGRNLQYEELDDHAAADTIATVLARGQFVGFFHGRMEFGPRALGARSILGNPCLASTQQIMNLKIKGRESFRPFAPIVLYEDVNEYFEFDRESPYMSFVVPVQTKRRKAQGALSGDSPNLLDAASQIRSDIPAVTHWDYSARVQTVQAASHKLLHRVLRSFKAQTGYSVLVNTSFNVRGEPIVCTPFQAYDCFMSTEIDYLYLDGFWLDKQQQPRWSGQKRPKGTLD